ncbi:hypothetical protein NDU88_003179 [Pleurodeles waltl]|uniref:Uncharacterized protein n=1 Tax=Pleurodeles waltl TaxID=8319 RepID=A0AAV7WRN9_PLEWA|nr:hypothetical protein NDU88_003179 [Pleurodeles waltl]
MVIVQPRGLSATPTRDPEATVGAALAAAQHRSQRLGRGTAGNFQYAGGFCLGAEVRVAAEAAVHGTMCVKNFTNRGAALEQGGPSPDHGLDSHEAGL